MVVRNTPHSTRSGTHALVIGGSMAGLLAARVLTDHFDQVTIVERDRLPTGPEFRPGVPQSRHIHVLMQRGQRIIEQLFPGLVADLLGQGALAIDFTNEMLLLNPAGWAAQHVSGLTTLACSRNLLEWSVRRRVLANPRVCMLEETEVSGLVTSAGNRSVTGVQVRSRRGMDDAGTAEATLSADLVIDAGGRYSKTPQWLTALGYAAPQETIVNARLGYATRMYQPPADSRRDWKAFVVLAAPPNDPRAGYIFPIERDRWLVGVYGGGGDYPPTDEAGYLKFARGLRTPLFYEAIKDAIPLSPIYGFRNTQNQLRHYDRLTRWPERFVVLGDGVCAFNPIYGQGMSTAAMGAITLGHCLHRHAGDDLAGMAHRFQKQLARIVAGPWMLATDEDYRFRGTQGGTPSPLTRFMHRYMDRVALLATHDQAVYRLFSEVIHMLTPPAALFGPQVVFKVVRGVIADQRGMQQPSRPPETARRDNRSAQGRSAG